MASGASVKAQVMDALRGTSRPLDTQLSTAPLTVDLAATLSALESCVVLSAEEAAGVVEHLDGTLHRHECTHCLALFTPRKEEA